MVSSSFRFYSGFVKKLLFILVSSSLLSSAGSVENFHCYMVYFSFLSSVGFVKKSLICGVLVLTFLCRFHQKFAPNHNVLILPVLCLHIFRLLQKFALLHGVLIFPLLYRICQKMLFILVPSLFLSSVGFVKKLLCIAVS